MTTYCFTWFLKISFLAMHAMHVQRIVSVVNSDFKLSCQLVDYVVPSMFKEMVDYPRVVSNIFTYSYSDYFDHNYF